MTPEERKEKKKEHNRKYREKQREMQQEHQQEKQQAQEVKVDTQEEQEKRKERQEIYEKSAIPISQLDEEKEYEEYTHEQLEEIINMRANQIANEKIKALNSQKVVSEKPKASIWNNQLIQSVGSSVAQTAGALLIPLTIRAIHGRLSSTALNNTGTIGMSAQPSQLSNIQPSFSVPSF
jgi:hypothetical protein